MKNNIKLLVMDVDGTLTDGKIYMSEQGELCKAFNIKDGYGIANILPKYNIIPIIITGRSSKIVEMRCKELGIKNYYQGVQNKLEKLSELLIKMNLSYNNVAYIGDDENDLQCILAIKYEKGICGCPYDAVKVIKSQCSFISKKNGGYGAVRDFIDYLIQKNG